MFIKTCCICILGVLLAKAGCHAAHQPNKMSNEKELTVFHYKVPCVGESVQLCFKVQTKEGATEFFYDAIEGFTYEWGYNYTLLVEEKAHANPPAGGSSVTYTLKKIVRKEKALPEETFELPLQLGGQALVASKDGRCHYWGNLEIETGPYTCADLLQAQVGVFRHRQNRAGLVLVALK